MEEAADLVDDETPGQEVVVEKLKVRGVEEAADLVEDETPGQEEVVEKLKVSHRYRENMKVIANLIQSAIYRQEKQRE